MARFTVMRLMPNCCCSADSLGTASPGRHVPLLICRLTNALTCSYAGNWVLVMSRWLDQGFPLVRELV